MPATYRPTYKPNPCATRVVKTQTLPRRSLFGRDALLIYDRKLLNRAPGFKRWTQSFSATYPVTSGESLKALEQFPTHMSAILRKSAELSKQKINIVVVGGGSVGDFGGFVASVLKRGVGLIHVPSTWLAAINSAHGGKTGLNANAVPNQVGTYYPADKVFVVKSLLYAQPQFRADEAKGELLKLALLDKNGWMSRLKRSQLEDDDLLWEFLLPAVKSKYKIIAKDPIGRKGLRGVLDLGHTFSRILEKHYGLPRGRAIAAGVYFSVIWSHDKKLLTGKKLNATLELLEAHIPLEDLNPSSLLKPLSRKAFVNLARQDKKMLPRDRMGFVFLRDIGEPIQRVVSISELTRQAERTGWIS